MSVGPVQSGSVGADPPSVEKRAQAPAKTPSPEVKQNPPVETTSAQNSSITTLPPEHEVQVRVDSSTNYVVVYRTVDKESGDLVTQVPSADQLRELQQTQEVLRRGEPRDIQTPPATPPQLESPGANLNEEG